MPEHKNQLMSQRLERRLQELVRDKFKRECLCVFLYQNHGSPEQQRGWHATIDLAKVNDKHVSDRSISIRSWHRMSKCVIHQPPLELVQAAPEDQTSADLNRHCHYYLRVGGHLLP